MKVMELKTCEALIKLLIEAGIADSDNVSGCTDQLIANIESSFNIKLPDSYKTFLKLMGEQAGAFYDDFGIFNIVSIEALEDTRKQAQSYLLDYANYTLKPTDFVFADMGTLTYLWFDTASVPEPPVQMLDDGDEEVKTPFNSFLEFLNVVANEQLECAAILE